MDAELKPCPFCGGDAISFDRREFPSVTKYHPTDTRYVCRIHGGINFDKEGWNNAYCWKRIKELEKELAKRMTRQELIMKALDDERSDG